MENTQLAIFEELQSMEQDKTTSSIKAIASDKQKNRVVAFDVGEKIGGSRKDIEELKRLFKSNPSLDLLEEIEEENISVAASIVSKDLFFSWFSLEDCRKRGMEVREAKSIESIIRRISKHPANDTVSRIKYLQTVQMVSDLLRSVVTREDFDAMIVYINHMLWAVRQLPVNVERVDMSDWENKKQYAQGYYNVLYVREHFDFDGLGYTFLTFFRSGKSRQKLYMTIQDKFPDWESVLGVQKKERKPRGKATVVWERALPSEPTRIGHKIYIPSHPEMFRNMFGFKGVEFGHYVNDLSALQHMKNSGKALHDLAYFLNVDVKALTFNGKLSLAFGARGRGSALGHYEPAKEVINLTKVKGSLGILAHEWAHALDHYLYNASHGFVKGRLDMLSELNEGMDIPHISELMANMIIEMKQGESIEYVNTDNSDQYRTQVTQYRLYRQVNGDAFTFMKSILKENEERARKHFSMILKNEKEIERKVTHYVRKNRDAYANLFRQIHEEQTGERLKEVPCPSPMSTFYNNSIKADKGKVGKYWSSNTELFARAFEYTVQRHLKGQGLVSDYLVCGAEGHIYPEGEEGDRIFEMMMQFLSPVSELLRNIE